MVVPGALRKCLGTFLIALPRFAGFLVHPNRFVVPSAIRRMDEMKLAARADRRATCYGERKVSAGETCLMERRKLIGADNLSHQLKRTRDMRIGNEAYFAR